MKKVREVFSGRSPRNQTLEQAPVRALVFINGVTNNEGIAKTMYGAGYTPEVNQEGWSLLRACTGFGMDFTTSTNSAAAAIREISDWCAKSYDRIDAALTHLHPEQREYVFKGLAYVTGVASVVVVETIIDRLDDLAGTGKGAEERKPHADADKKALATLAARGFGDAEIKRVHALITTAHTITPPAPEAKPTAGTTHEERLAALKAWYDDWATTAHRVIEKRTDLIKIGLAKPRHTKVGSNDDPATPNTKPVQPAEVPHA
jgi:hypothetical protein